MKQCTVCGDSFTKGFHVVRDSGIICQFCSTSQSIVKYRDAALAGVTNTGEKMKERSKHLFPPVKFGQCVIVPLPEFDRNPLDEKNFIGKVIAMWDNLHIIGSAHGILKNRLWIFIYICQHESGEHDGMTKEEICTRVLEG